MKNRILSRVSSERRFLWLLIGNLILVGLLVVLYVGMGRLSLSPLEVVLAIFDEAVKPSHRIIVWDLRLPRALIALVAGAMLGLAGALMQSLTRNPLADPGITGVSAGSVLLIVFWSTYMPVMSNYRLLFPLIGLVGALGTALILYLMSWQRGVDPLRLVLVGIMLSAILTSMTSLVLLQNANPLSGFLLWIVGSLNGRVWVDWHLLWPWGLMTLPVGLLCAGVANTLQLGDEVAAGLGLRVERVRALLLFVAVVLTAGAISIVGAISFIGLVGPHIARRLVGDDARRVFPLSAVLAAVILLLADLIATTLTINPPFRVAQNPTGLPVGAVTMFLGAPFLLYLLRKRSV